MSVLLRLRTGDAEGYRRLCREMIQRFVDNQSETAKDAVAWRIATTCLLTADAVDNPQEVWELADRNVRDNPTWEWPKIWKALAEYRAGRFQSALDFLPLMQQPRQESLVALIRCMAHHKLGHSEQAARALGRAHHLIHEQEMKADWGPYWWGWMFCQFLSDEAEALLGGERNLAPSVISEDRR